MKRFNSTALTIALVTAIAAVVVPWRAVGGEEPELIPRDVLFGNPTQNRARISPDGTKLAYLAPYEGVLNVWVGTIGAEDDRPVTRDVERPITNFRWAQDREHILFLRDRYGDENHHLYAVPSAGGEPVDLTPYPGVKVRILEHDKHYPAKVVLEMNKRDPELFDVYALDLETRELEMIAENPGNVRGWDVDAELAVRAANALLPDGGEQLWVRDGEGDEWRVLVEWEYDDALASTSIDFAGDGDWIYMKDSRNANAGRLVKINIRTSETVVIGEDPRFDVRRFLFDPDTYEIQAYSIAKAREEWVVVDESVAADFEAIGNLGEGDFNVQGRDNADENWVVYFNSADASGRYYVYHRDTKTATFLFDVRPELSRFTLAPMEPVSYAARDGLTIDGYATFPPGRDRENLPAVILVHGGPHVRYHWGWHGGVQLLANRGYLVLQVNYRGSTGYGKDFLNAGRKEWGGKMQDDVTDAARWAVTQGWADPERVAIMGASYGGYAALAGATFTPDVFACAVSAMGPSNLITFLETVPPYWKPYMARMKLLIGDPAIETEFLRSRSPLFHVERIKIPILLMYGANDARVKISEGEQIVAAMAAKEIDYEFIVFPDEGHGFQQPRNRIKYYAAAEGFLAKYLGGRYEPYEEQ